MSSRPWAIAFRSRPEDRIGARARWPVNACVCYYRDRPCGLYLRFGSHAVAFGWH